MAKSLRASRNKVNKTLKRKSVFGEADNARALRLAEKLHQRKEEEAEKAVKEAKAEAASDDMDTSGQVTISALNKKRKLIKAAKKAKKQKHRHK